MVFIWGKSLTWSLWYELWQHPISLGHEEQCSCEISWKLIRIMCVCAGGWLARWQTVNPEMCFSYFHRSETSCSVAVPDHSSALFPRTATYNHLKVDCQRSTSASKIWKSTKTITESLSTWKNKTKSFEFQVWTSRLGRPETSLCHRQAVNLNLRDHAHLHLYETLVSSAS